ncbi:MAG: EamA family transporter [Terriglobales bacterium]
MQSRRAALWAGFAVIYIFWGGTFLAIRIGVEQMAPLLVAAARFLLAGGLLYAWARWRGVPHPTAREWWGATELAVFMFLAGYGVLFWAETLIPSGIAAVLAALIPLWVALLEGFVFRSEPASLQVIGGCLLGAAGVGVLMSGRGGGGRLAVWPMLARVGAALAWALGRVLINRLPMPRSPVMNAAAQMLVGGVMLAAAAAPAGAYRQPAHCNAPLVWSLAYLVLIGSVLAYSVYIWLLGHVSAVSVSTYALANPVIALLIGWWWAGERLGWRAGLGSGIILAALVLVLTRPRAAGKLSNKADILAPSGGDSRAS